MLESNALRQETTPTREALIAEALTQMGAVIRIFYRRFRQPGEPEIFELTMPQCRAVLCLEQGPLHMSRLAATLSVALPSATGIVDRLVERGLVAREEDPQDRRLVLCALTPQGERMATGLYEGDVAVLEGLVHTLSNEDLRIILQGLTILVNAAGQRADSYDQQRQKSSIESRER